MKHLYLIFTLLFFISNAMWGTNTLVLVKKNGESHKYILSKKPEITFLDNTLVIQEDIVTTEYPRADIEIFFFENTETSISKNFACNFKFEWINANSIKLYGDDILPVYAYNTSGQKQIIKVTKKLDVITLDLSTLPQGVYIIKANNNQSIKIKK